MSDPSQKSEQEQESEAASLFAPGLLHELRQPLTGLRAGLELALRETGGQIAALEGFRVVEAQTERLLEIVREFEELFATKAVRQREFALAEVVERGVRLLRFRLRPLGERFELQALPAPAMSRGSPAALLHALTNLLVNASDAVEAASPSARIAVRLLSPEGGPRQVRVSDEGPGIDPAVRAGLFVARVTTKGARGTGLGLQIARRVMQHSGGDVRLVDESDPLRLPWARTEFCIDVAAAT